MTNQTSDIFDKEMINDIEEVARERGITAEELVREAMKWELCK
jgi:hypothetical protein